MLSALLTMVMFSAWPSNAIDSGEVPSSRAPFQYIGWVGPGTLEMTMLNAGGAVEAQPGTADSPSGALRAADGGEGCSRGNSANTFLLPRIDALIVSSRVAG